MTDFRIIVRSIVTEKAAIAQENGKYTFEVTKAANKISVKQAIESMYGVKVKSVHMMIQPSKSRQIRTGTWIKRKLMKKAIVTLQAGQTLDPNNPTFKKTKK